MTENHTIYYSAIDFKLVLKELISEKKCEKDIEQELIRRMFPGQDSQLIEVVFTDVKEIAGLQTSYSYFERVIELMRKKGIVVSVQENVKNTVIIKGKELEVLVDGIVNNADNSFNGLSTGIDELDALVGGFENGLLYIIGGRPMTGKTTFALDIVKNLAVKQGRIVEMCSLEMSSSRFVKKLLTKVSENDLKESKLIINDNYLLDAGQVEEDGVEMIILDYIQLAGINYINSTNKDKVNSRSQEIENVLWYLKDMARRLNIPIVVMSQISRNVEYREYHRPLLPDLRDSGVMEEIADVVMFLYCDWFYDACTDNETYCNNSYDSDSRFTEIIVAKNRYGRTGVVKHEF